MSGIEHLLDTSLIIGLLNGDEPAAALAEAAHLDLRRSAVSQITRMELLAYPDLTAEEEAVISEFLGNCRVLTLTEAVEAEAIRIRRAVRLKLPDAIIAATAIIFGLRLLALDQELEGRLKELGYGG